MKLDEFIEESRKLCVARKIKISKYQFTTIGETLPEKLALSKALDMLEVMHRELEMLGESYDSKKFYDATARNAIEECEKIAK